MSTTQESATSTSESNESKVIGQVKWFNIKAGYGFITLLEGENKGKDIFVHYSSLKVVNSQYRYLVQGEYVEFNLVKLDGEKYEYHAVDVSGIKGGPIMCEARRSSVNTRSGSRDDEERGEQHRVSRDDEERGGPRRVSRDDEERGGPRRVSRRPTTRDVHANEEPGFEKVVKKRQPRTKV